MIFNALSLETKTLLGRLAVLCQTPTHHCYIGMQMRTTRKMSAISRERVGQVSRELSLPEWWVETVIVEYFECRRYAEGGRLWTFDFSKVSKEEMASILDKKVVVPAFFLVQNIRSHDLGQRALLGLGGWPTAPLDEGNLKPEGPVNNSAFPFVTNDISTWDPKLGFNYQAIVRDKGRFYQWTVAENATLPGKNYHWYQSSLFNLDELLSIYERLIELRNSDAIKNDSSARAVSAEYAKLEAARRPIREKILAFHDGQKPKYAAVKASVGTPPMLSIFDSVKLSADGYSVKTHMEPLFFRAAIRNLQKAKLAREKLVTNPRDQTALLDEIEAAAMCLISATSCLESYINGVIARYLPDEAETFRRASLRQKWLWVPAALNLPVRFKPGEEPFKDFSYLVELRNSAIHHEPVYQRARNQFSRTYSQLNLENAQIAVKTIVSMVSVLSRESSIPLPAWLRRGLGSAEFWDEVTSYLNQSE